LPELTGEAAKGCGFCRKNEDSRTVFKRYDTFTTHMPSFRLVRATVS